MVSWTYRKPNNSLSSLYLTSSDNHPLQNKNYKMYRSVTHGCYSKEFFNSKIIFLKPAYTVNGMNMTLCRYELERFTGILHKKWIVDVGITFSISCGFNVFSMTHKMRLKMCSNCNASAHFMHSPPWRPELKSLSQNMIYKSGGESKQLELNMCM